MNDPKAAATYHPGDAPVTRPDLEALIAAAQRDINDANRCQTMGIMPATHQLHRRLREVTAALAAERARADQAVKAIVDAPHERGCGMTLLPGYLHAGECFCWKSTAPTAEQ